MSPKWIFHRFNTFLTFFSCVFDVYNYTEKEFNQRYTFYFCKHLHKHVRMYFFQKQLFYVSLLLILFVWHPMKLYEHVRSYMNAILNAEVMFQCTIFYFKMHSFSLCSFHFTLNARCAFAWYTYSYFRLFAWNSWKYFLLNHTSRRFIVRMISCVIQFAFECYGICALNLNMCQYSCFEHT